MITPLPAASPSALSTAVGRLREIRSSAWSAAQHRVAGGRHPAAAISSLAWTFDPPGGGAARGRRRTPASASASTRPLTRGASGPTTTRSTPVATAARRHRHVLAPSGSRQRASARCRRCPARRAARPAASAQGATIACSRRRRRRPGSSMPFPSALGAAGARSPFPAGRWGPRPGSRWSSSRASRARPRPSPSCGRRAPRRW